MSLEKELMVRANQQCELCGAKENLQPYAVPAAPSTGVESAILTCVTCEEQLTQPEKIDTNHWRCLNDSIWSSVPAVQVVSWRMLNRLISEGWPQDLLDMMYMEEETLAWAKATNEFSGEAVIIHKDAHGNILEVGDTVTLVKDLTVKGANFTAKRGTAVRRISLVADNPAHIEGKINGQHIVILTQYVKKQK